VLEDPDGNLFCVVQVPGEAYVIKENNRRGREPVR